MNRTLLLIICDFLLLNLLALTRWESVEPEATRQPPVPAVAANATATSEDMVASMRTALEEERAAREKLAEQMRSDVASRDATVRSLDTRRQELEVGLQQARQSAQELAARLTNTLSAAAQQAAQLQQQAVAAQQQLSQTGARLAEIEKARESLSENVKLSEAERRKLSDALGAEREAARRQQQALAAVENEKREAERRAAELASAVKVADAERALLRENVSELKQQVTRVQLEKDRIQAQTAALATGVTQLAAKSEELKQEIRDNTPASANILFQDFLSNRVEVVIGGTASGLFSTGPREKASATVLISDGVKTSALVHVNESPYSLSIPGFGLDQPTVRVQARGGGLTSGSAGFLRADPRGLVVPVDPASAQKAGVRVYQLAKNPFKFADALLVSRGGRYFGEVEFRLDPKTPGYVRMKTKVFSRLFGEFSPSSGDLVVSRSGEILGLMVNSEYCVVLSDVQPAAGGTLDPALTKAAVGKKLEEFRAMVDRLPAGLQ
jgi:hypothetical protein